MAHEADEDAPDDLGRNERIERILRAAQQAFLAHGYHGASTDMIQAAAGVSKSTVYRYFPNKEELFRAAFEAYNKDFLTHIGQIYKNTNDPEEFLFKFGMELVRRQRDDARGLGALFRPHQRGALALERQDRERAGGQKVFFGAPLVIGLRRPRSQKMMRRNRGCRAILLVGESSRSRH